VNKHVAFLPHLLTSSPVQQSFINEAANAASLGTSAAEWYNTVVLGTKSDDVLATSGSSWVDVRDVALAHVRAIQKEEAGGGEDYYFC
jgi:hypothetical protein